MGSMRRIELSPGQMLFKQGERGSKLLVVVDGVLSVHSQVSAMRTQAALDEWSLDVQRLLEE